MGTYSEYIVRKPTLYDVHQIFAERNQPEDGKWNCKYENELQNIYGESYSKTTLNERKINYGYHHALRKSK